MSLIARDEEHARELRDALDRAFAAGNLAIVNGFLCDVTAWKRDEGADPEPLVDLVAIKPDSVEQWGGSWPIQCPGCGERGTAYGADETIARTNWLAWHRAIMPQHRHEVQ